MKKFIIYDAHNSIMDVCLSTSVDEALSLWNNPEGWTAAEVKLTKKEINALGRAYGRNLK